jgi:release factor H-coupled RctB family protein
MKTPDLWIDDDAVARLHKAATLPGMRLAAGMPDLHPGKGRPIGAGVASYHLRLKINPGV